MRLLYDNGKAKPVKPYKLCKEGGTVARDILCCGCAREEVCISSLHFVDLEYGTSLRHRRVRSQQSSERVSRSDFWDFEVSENGERVGMNIACLTVRPGGVCATLVKSSNVEYI